MISVLLTLLKIIGVVLLILLGLLVLLIILVLFIPVKYRIKGYYEDSLVYYIKASWLLHLISVSFCYDKESETSIRIFGIPISVFYKANKDTANNKKKSEAIHSEKEKDTIKNTNSIKKVDFDKEEPTDISLNHEERTEDIESSSDTILKNEHKTIIQKILIFFHNLREKLYNYINAVKEFFYKIKSKKQSFEYYISLLKSTEVKEAFSLCKKRIFKILKHILPKRMKVTLHLGFEDPATTGYVLGIYSILPDVLSKKIIVYPDFNNKVFKCNFDMKGYMNAWNFLYHVLCILMDKNCKSLYQIVKKEILNERK